MNQEQNRAGRWLWVVGAAVLLVGTPLAAAACGNDVKDDLVDAAVGTWSCREQRKGSGQGLVVRVRRNETFTVGAADAAPRSLDVSGRWKLDGTEVTATIERKPTTLPVVKLLVHGAELDARHIDVGGVFEDAEGHDQRIEVHRTGTDRVTFKADEKDATTWLCTKQ